MEILLELGLGMTVTGYGIRRKESKVAYSFCLRQCDSGSSPYNNEYKKQMNSVG